MAKNVDFKINRLEYAKDFHCKYIDSTMSVNRLAREVVDTVEDERDRETTFRRYKRNRKMPKEMLQKVADLLQVDIRYLTGEWNEKTWASVSVSDLVSSLQGEDILAKRTDPDGVYILPPAGEDVLLFDAVMQTQHFVNKIIRKYRDPVSGELIEYSSLFDSQHYLELLRIFEKIVQTAASQQIAYHPDHISLSSIYEQIKNEHTEIVTVEFKE